MLEAENGIRYVERFPASLASADVGGRGNSQIPPQGPRAGQIIGVTLGTFSWQVARFKALWATLIFLSFFHVNVWQ